MYDFVVTLLQPFPLLYLSVGVATLNLWRKPREKRGRLIFLTSALVGLTLVTTPAAAYLALGSLEWQYAPLDNMPEDVQAIVVLSAGIRPSSGARAEAELDEDGMQRCLHAAALYRQKPSCTVIVSGGKVNPQSDAPPCSQVMAAFLVQLGVKAADIVQEDSSRNTYENAVQTSRLLKEREIRKAVLVVDAVDMFRALSCFRQQGLELEPAPCHYRATEFEMSFFDFVPNPGAAVHGQRAWHEWLGTAWYWLNGRI